MNSTTATRLPIAIAQIRRIHALARGKRYAAMTDENYRDFLYGNFGVASSKELTYAKANHAIFLLEELSRQRNRTEKKKKKYDDVTGRPTMATPKQLRMIEGKWADVSRAPDAEGRSKALQVWLHHRFGRSDILFVERGLVRKINLALDEMKRAKVAAPRAIDKGQQVTGNGEGV